MSQVYFPYIYVPDPTKGKPVANGYLYIGQVDQDPQSFPIAVNGRQEDGTLVSLVQPIRTSAGGVPLYNGSPVTLEVEEFQFSMQVLNSQSSQVYYQPKVFGVSNTADQISFDNTVTGQLNAENVQDAIDELTTFDTLAEALAQPDQVLGQYVETRQYESGTGYGGNVYRVVAGGTGTADGGSYIDKTDGSGYQFEGLFLDGVPKAHQFGCVNGNDITTQIQAFFDYVNSGDQAQYDWTCEGEISSGVIYQSPGSSLQNKGKGMLSLECNTAITGAALTFDTCQLSEFGSLKLLGTGDSEYSTRTCERGVRFISSARSTFQKMDVRHFKEYGVWGDGAGSGNNNQMNFRFLNVDNCGSNGVNGNVGNLPLDYTNLTNSGSAGNNGQRTTINFSGALPSEILSINDGSGSSTGEKCSFLLINGYPYPIIQIANDRLSCEVFPWVDSATPTSGTLDSMHGGAVVLQGGNAGEWQIGNLETQNTGCSIRDAALYNSNILTHTCIRAGIGVCIGNEPNSSNIGHNSTYLYTENCRFDVVQLNDTYAGATFNATQEVTPDDILKIDARENDDSITNPILNGVDFQNLRNHGRLTGSQEKAPNNTNAQATIEIRDYSINSLTYKFNNFTLTLTDDADMRNLGGYKTIEVMFFGTGGSNEPTGTITVQPDSGDTGYTVNGGASVVYSGLSQPIKLHCTLDVTVSPPNWQIAKFDAS